MTPDDVITKFKEHAGLLEGHFLLSSGLHSPEYWQCAKVLSHTDAAAAFGEALAEKIADLQPTLIVGPAMGGLIIAHEVARAMHLPMIFTERQDGEMALRRGFSVDPRDRIVICEDVVTTGKSSKEVQVVLESHGAAVVGVCCIIDRSSGASGFSVPFRSLAQADVVTYTPDACPLCADGSTAIKPGSRPKP